MPENLTLKLDEVGVWTETKLAIIREYIEAYAKIFSAPNQQRYGLQHIYIDGFSGPGQHISRNTRARIEGSPLNALGVASPFKELYFVDANPRKIAHLQKIINEKYGSQMNNAHVMSGDCNELLPKKIFPIVERDQKKRAVCLLDPYGMHVKWEVIRRAGQSKKMDVFINFSTMDINMNALTKYKNTATPAGILRFSELWGDASWENEFYAPDLFGDHRKISFSQGANEKLAERFRHRLVEIAGFRCVPEPIPMKNKSGGTVYYLFFASYNDNAAKNIIEAIFKKHRKKLGLRAK